MAIAANNKAIWRITQYNWRIAPIKVLNGAMKKNPHTPFKAKIR